MIKKNLSIFLTTVLSISLTMPVAAQKTLYSKELAATIMNTWQKDSFALVGKPAIKWTYDLGVMLEGIAAVWKNTGEAKYFEYIQNNMDFYVEDNGNIKTYKKDEFNIDHVKNGRSLLMLYRITGKQKYWKAATLLRSQLQQHPRTQEGGFWHKKIYPNQMWLDGLYMAEPFYAEYAMLAHEDSAFDDIANQFIWMENHARNAGNGLLYHGWDESKQMGWANVETGVSPHFWGRAMGWYAVALVDVLENFPVNHPKRNDLVQILNRLINAVEKVQDPKSGLWYDILDLPNEKGNYQETSASSMFILAIAKGNRLGFIPDAKLKIAEKAYKGLTKKIIKKENGFYNLYGVVKVSGLGGKPYRDGSLAYYFSEPVVVNDPKGIGAFVAAAAEMEMQATIKLGKGKKIVLDGYFNQEFKKDVTGKTIQTHYLWNQMDNGGYSLLGHIFNRYGVQTNFSTSAITPEVLNQNDIYFITDPDGIEDNPQPNFISAQQIDYIYDWVKKGGVLMLFTNDSGNAELKNINQLGKRFGLLFNEHGPINMVKNNEFSTGTINIAKGNKIFKNTSNVFLKEISTISIHNPALAVLSKDGKVVVAISKIGKGAVFAVGDPWLYNEYLDGRKLPASIQNYSAAEDLVKWIIKQSKR